MLMKDVHKRIMRLSDAVLTFLGRSEMIPYFLAQVSFFPKKCIQRCTPYDIKISLIQINKNEKYHSGPKVDS